MKDCQMTDILNLCDDDEDAAFDSDISESDWLRPIDDNEGDERNGEKMLLCRAVAILPLVCLLVLAMMSRKEAHDSRLYYDGTNAIQVTRKSMKVFWFERCQCNTNTNVKVMRDGNQVEVVGLTD
jgi:hypothetical protein